LRRSVSQIGRQSFPHRPTHLNSLKSSSMAPPHSGQMLDLCGLLATVRGSLDAFPEALLNNLFESHTSPGEPCLHCSGWHPEELRRFANAQTIDIAQSKGCAQSGREPQSRMSQCFRNLSLAIYLFGIWSGIRYDICRGEILLATGFIQGNLHLWGTPTQLHACGINDDRRQPRGHLCSPFELVYVCPG
jgi:hypothetical protein